MLKVTIFFVGRERGGWEGEYIERLKGNCLVEWVACRGDDQLTARLERERQVVLLDPAGQQLDSEEFSRFLFEQLEAGGSRLALAIGGAEGLPQALRSRFPMISLSRLTFPHELVRVILAEQLYRAFEIRRGSPYHK
ncbi:MAG: 23S rRNA (pseudouridine(1915)-N(3))-methyltransferase RlmH [Parachlamydiales bacterium]